MLELDRQVAAERRLAVRTVEASMDDMPALAAGEFDIVIHPVSTCYVPAIGPVYREVARVTRAGGLYISQHKTPASLQADVSAVTARLRAQRAVLSRWPTAGGRRQPHREEGTLEYLHRWEELLGLMCRAGFVIEDLLEPLHAREGAEPGSFGHRSRFVAPYVRVKARRTICGGGTISGENDLAAVGIADCRFQINAESSICNLQSAIAHHAARCSASRARRRVNQSSPSTERATRSSRFGRKIVSSVSGKNHAMYIPPPSP